VGFWGWGGVLGVGWCLWFVGGGYIGGGGFVWWGSGLFFGSGPGISGAGHEIGYSLLREGAIATQRGQGPGSNTLLPKKNSGVRRRRIYSKAKVEENQSLAA